MAPETVQADAIKEFKRKKKECEIQDELRKQNSNCGDEILLTLSPHFISAIVSVSHDILHRSRRKQAIYFFF